MWLNAHNDITLWIKVPNPLLFNVKLNAISLKLDIPNTFYDNKKVSKGAKIRNRYNQVPHLTQDTNGKVTNSVRHHKREQKVRHHKREQEVLIYMNKLPRKNLKFWFYLTIW